MGKVTILPETTKDPISLIGRRAGICFRADITNPEKNYKRGLDCIEKNHGRALEFVNIEAIIEGYSARTIRQWYTHVGGAPTRLQASTRYIDYAQFEYIIPESIETEEQKKLYCDAMEDIRCTIEKLNSEGVSREDSALLLPLGMETIIVDKRNVRNAMDMSRQRMCKRTYWEFRKLFNDYLDELSKYSKEWEELIPMIMMPKCKSLGYCPEKNSCKKTEDKNEQKN